MNIEVLKNELLVDPLGRGYAAMSDSAAAVSLNTVNRQINKVAMTGTEVLNALDKVEFLALTDANKLKVWDVLHLGTINPFGIEAEIFIEIFGAGSASLTALNAARRTSVSRATELGQSFVYPGHVENARY